MTEIQKLIIKLSAYESAHKQIKGAYWDTLSPIYKRVLDLISFELAKADRRIQGNGN